MSKPKILVIVGPTASGKSSLGIRLAKKISAVGGPASGWKGAEIVSADSRQVYKGLDIGSGKVTKREIQGVPHHMLDVENPRRVFSVSQYQKLAYKVIDDILKRNKLPIIVGGTGQYIDAITKGFIYHEVKPRADLRKKLSKLTNAQMFKMLKRLDPRRAKDIDKNNPRRLVRAIEIAMALGKVPELKSEPRYSPIILGLKIENRKLKINIRRRLVKGLKQGLVAEATKLHKAGLSWRRMYDLGLEYRYVSLYLQNRLTKPEMLTKLESEIVKYAKRQMTWFKRDKQIKWLSNGEIANKHLLASLPGLRGSANLLFLQR